MARQIDKELTDIIDEFNAHMAEKFDKIDESIKKLKAAINGEKVDD